MAVLLARGGLRTTLQARTNDQAQQLNEHRENRIYLSGVELPRELRIESVDAGLARADYVFLGVPSIGLAAVIDGLERNGLPPRGTGAGRRRRGRRPHLRRGLALGGGAGGPPGIDDRAGRDG